MKKLLLFGAIMLLITTDILSAKTKDVWDKTFPKSDSVTVQKVYFKNRFGITLAGDLYVPKNIQKDEKLPAIAISGPFGAVKEQASGLYAQNLAERGFITLAFDPSYTGESSGTPRHVASPDINTEDFSAAVDFLMTRTNVDNEKTGILGICGFGGFAINAAAVDTRIKATIASTMYDMTRVKAYGYNDTVDKEARFAVKEQLNKQRTEDFKNVANGKKYAPGDGLPEQLTGNEPLFVQQYWDYYKTKRGFHPRSINSNGAWNMTSDLSLINQPILAYASEIKSAVMIIHGETAHSRYFGEDTYKKLRGDNKKLLIVKGANHTDLYDNQEKIPFDEAVKFYRENLK